MTPSAIIPRMASTIAQFIGEIVMPEDSKDQTIHSSQMPQFDASEKMLNAIKRSNAQTGKLIQLGYFLVTFQAISTLIAVTVFIIAILN